MFEIGDYVVILPGFRGYFEAHQYEGLEGIIIDIGGTYTSPTYHLDIYRKGAEYTLYAFKDEIAIKKFYQVILDA